MMLVIMLPMVAAMVRTSNDTFPSGVGASVLEDGANDGGDNDGGPLRCRCQCQHGVLIIANNKSRESTEERLQPLRDSHRYRHHVPHLPFAQVLFD